MGGGWRVEGRLKEMRVKGNEWVEKFGDWGRVCVCVSVSASVWERVTRE
jgi:hypothetical protein